MPILARARFGADPDEAPVVIDVLAAPIGDQGPGDRCPLRPPPLSERSVSSCPGGGAARGAGESRMGPDTGVAGMAALAA